MSSLEVGIRHSDMDKSICEGVITSNMNNNDLIEHYIE